MNVVRGGWSSRARALPRVDSARNASIKRITMQAELLVSRHVKAATPSIP